MFTFIQFSRYCCTLPFYCAELHKALFCSTFLKSRFFFNIFVFFIVIVTKTELVLPFLALLMVISVNLFVFVVMNFGQF